MSTTATIGVYLTTYSLTKPADLYDLAPESVPRMVQYSALDMTDQGWIRVGTADVIVTLTPRASVIAAQVAVLQNQRAALLADAAQSAARIEREIQSLMAIEYSPAGDDNGD